MILAVALKGLDKALLVPATSPLHRRALQDKMPGSTFQSCAPAFDVWTFVGAATWRFVLTVVCRFYVGLYRCLLAHYMFCMFYMSSYVSCRVCCVYMCTRILMCIYIIHIDM